MLFSWERKIKKISYSLFTVVLLIIVMSKYSNQITYPDIYSAQTTQPPSYTLITEAYYAELIGHYQEGSGYVYDVVAEDNYAYLVDTEQGLVVVNTTDKLNLIKTGNYSNGGYPYGIDIQGNYGFIADSPQGLEIHDISNKSNPHQIAVFKEGSGQTFGVKVVGDYAYLANGYDGLEIIDISNKTNPQKIGGYDPGGEIRSVAVTGNYTFIGGLATSRVTIVNTTVKTNPQYVANVSLHNAPIDIFIENKYAYITYFDEYIAILNISDLQSPQIIADINIGGQLQQSVLHNNYLCVIGNVGLRFYNIANKSNPIHEGTYNSGIGGLNGIKVHNDLIYLADASDGLELIGQDFDLDGLADYLELNVYFTNPNTADSDGDGLEDGEEIDSGTNPNDWDSDDDLLDDYWEVTYGTDPNVPDADEDPDGDELSNAEEKAEGTNPLDADSDDDGLDDGEEVNTYLTDPLDPDTDDDTYHDGFEVEHGSDPLDSNSVPRDLTTWYVVGGVGGFFVIVLFAIFLSSIIRSRRARRSGIATFDYEEYIEPLAFEEQETPIGIVEDLEELIISSEPVKRDITVSYLTELLKVRSIIIMEKNGVPLFSRNFSVDVDSALAAGFLTAVHNFGEELISREKKRDYQFIQMGQEGGYFWIFSGKYVRLALLLETEAYKDFKKPLWDFLKKFEIFFQAELEGFSGRVTDFDSAIDILEMELKINYLYDMQIDVDGMEELDLDEKSLVPVLEYYIENFDKDVKFTIVELIDRAFKELKNMNHDEILEQIIFFVEGGILRPIPEQIFDE